MRKRIDRQHEGDDGPDRQVWKLSRTEERHQSSQREQAGGNDRKAEGERAAEEQQQPGEQTHRPSLAGRLVSEPTHGLGGSGTGIGVILGEPSRMGLAAIIKAEQRQCGGSPSLGFLAWGFDAGRDMGGWPRIDSRGSETAGLIGEG
jgi:hypothetical protein